MRDFLKKYSKPLKLIMQLALVVLIIWLMYGRLQAGFEQAVKEASIFSWQTLLIVVLFAAAVMVSGYLWGGLVKLLDPSFREIPLSESIQVHVVSWLLKYIPGQVGTLLSKMAWGGNNNLSKKVVVSSLIYENIFLASSSLILAVPVVGLSTVSSFGKDLGLLLPFLMSLAILPLLIPGVLMWAVNLGLKIVRKKPFSKEHVLTASEIFRNQILYLLPRIINGIGFVVIVLFFSELSIFASASA